MTPERMAVGRKAIDALIEMLPPTGSAFPIKARKRWLDAMAATLILVYGVDGEIVTKIDGDEISIEPKAPEHEAKD